MTKFGISKHSFHKIDNYLSTFFKFLAPVREREPVYRNLDSLMRRHTQRRGDGFTSIEDLTVSFLEKDFQKTPSSR